MKPGLPLCSVLGILGTLAVCSGCSFLQPREDVIRYFALAARPLASPPEAGAVFLEPVGVAPVSMPAHLRRRSLAVRQGATEVAYLDQCAWSESLEQGVRQVLVANLSSRLGSPQVLTGAWISGMVSREVHVAILQFEAATGGEVRLRVLWRITGAGGRGVHRAGEWRFSRLGPLPTRDPGGSVAVMSDGLAELSDVLADALRTGDGKG